jgi:hypothetical protein
MNTSDHPEPDPLSELLSAPPPSAGGERLRHAVFMQTAGVMRRRRIVRRGLYGTALAACYFAGVATTGLLWRGDGVSGGRIAVQTPEPADGMRETGTANETDPGVKPENQVADDEPRAKNRFEFFRAAGDHQLLARGDMRAAVRLYARALELASPEELAISAESDNWLLMSLKQSRLEEIRNADQEI